jgi:hypothetical protein
MADGSALTAWGIVLVKLDVTVIFLMLCIVIGCAAATRAQTSHSSKGAWIDRTLLAMQSLVWLMVLNFGAVMLGFLYCVWYV